MNSENAQSQMRKGILEFCTLLLLSKQDMYASDIIQQLKDAKMIVVEGTLYPLLMRQKNAGLLSYRWEESTQGPPRKYYTITDSGKEYLAELNTAWSELISTVDTLKIKTI
jgi:PadR family transcriptional regulator, regulatory protein PadR